MRYRICRNCGEKWNVSTGAKNVKKYICPFVRIKKEDKQ